jgi:hypothetical protein
VNKLLKFLNKYWIILSICATIITSLLTWGWHLKGRIDADEDKINDMSAWVSAHDDDIQTIHDDLNKLKEDERLREAGLCK